MPQKPSPYGGNAAQSGPSPDVFFLTTAMNDSALAVDAPVANPLLTKEVRFVECVATGATLTLQSRGGGVFTKTFAVGDVFDRGYVVAVKGVPDNTSFIGGV